MLGVENGTMRMRMRMGEKRDGGEEESGGARVSTWAREENSGYCYAMQIKGWIDIILAKEKRVEVVWVRIVVIVCVYLQGRWIPK